MTSTWVGVADPASDPSCSWAHQEAQWAAANGNVLDFLSGIPPERQLSLRYGRALP